MRNKFKIPITLLFIFLCFVSDPEETKDIELTVQTLHTAPICQPLPPLDHKLKRRHKLCCIL